MPWTRFRAGVYTGDAMGWIRGQTGVRWSNGIAPPVVKRAYGIAPPVVKRAPVVRWDCTASGQTGVGGQMGLHRQWSAVVMALTSGQLGSDRWANGFDQ